MGITTQQKRPGLRNQAGFTLIEILSVLVILGILASTTIYRFDLLSQTASRTALSAGVKELNVRETLAWVQAKLSDDGWENDDKIFAAVAAKELGSGYSWNPEPDKTGGTLHFRDQSTVLTRMPSTVMKSGSWQ